MREIRRLDPLELETLSVPLRRYAFGGSPPSLLRPRGDDDRETPEESETFVVLDAGAALATVSVEKLEQNIRRSFTPAWGVSRVAAHPDARRGGHVRALLEFVHSQATASRQEAAILYPFRPSFYTRFDYISLHLPRHLDLHLAEASFPADDSCLVSMFEPGDARGLALLEEAEERWLAVTHGGVRRSDSKSRRGASTRDLRYTAVARKEGRAVGAMTFHNAGFGGSMVVGRFFADSVEVRNALLRWAARHGDQFSSLDAEFAPDFSPELTLGDVGYSDRSRISLPTQAAPMARILSMRAFDGVSAPTGRIVIAVPELATGAWQLESVDGSIRVTKTGVDADATLSIADASRALYGAYDRGTLPPSISHLLPPMTAHLGMHF